MLQELQNKLDGLTEAQNKLTLFDNDYAVSVIKKAIIKDKRDIKNQIDEIERRERTELHMVNIDGVDIEIPRSFHFGRGYKYFYDDNILYALSPKGLDKDGSFHYWCYAWIPNEDKYVNLLVRALGKDRFGDRIFTEARYYKDKRDQYSYLDKSISPNNYKYKTYIDKVIKLVRVHNDEPDFMKGEKRR